ncbi:MAG: ABC-2 family transporter protein [Patescibacteria group bacterium]
MRLYRALFRFNIQNLIVYRAHFINSTISTVGWGVFQYVWIELLTIRTKSAFGWSKQELVTLAILYIIIIGIFHFFFSRNFDRFSRIIDKGELDFLLIKPVDSQLIATTHIHNYPNLIRVILGVFFLMIYTRSNNLFFTIQGWIGLVVLAFFGIMLLYSLWLFYCTLLIWFPRLTNVVEFLYTINGMARYPAEMIRELRNFVLFFLLPFSISIATPAKVLVRGAWDGDILFLIGLSGMFFILTRVFWKYALQHYTSASS